MTFFSKKRVKVGLILAAAVGFATVGARAASVFTYGEYTGSTLNPANFQAFDSSRTLGSFGFPTLSEYYFGATDPNVIYNNGTHDVLTDPQYGDIDFQAKTINLGPYLGPTLVRYTAATAGYYDIESSFQTVQIGNNAPVAYVFEGSTNVFTQQLVGNPNALTHFGTTAVYSDSHAFLTAGETVDFVVYGGNSNNKTVQLDLTVTPPSGPVVTPAFVVPLPQSAGLGFSMLGGFGLLAGFRKRLSRKPRIA